MIKFHQKDTKLQCMIYLFIYALFSKPMITNLKSRTANGIKALHPNRILVHSSQCNCSFPCSFPHTCLGLERAQLPWIRCIRAKKTNVDCLVKTTGFLLLPLSTRQCMFDTHTRIIPKLRLCLPQKQSVEIFPTAKKACDCFHLWSISSEAVQQKYLKSQHGQNEQDMQPWCQTIRVILWTPDEVH